MRAMRKQVEAERIAGFSCGPSRKKTWFTPSSSRTVPMDGGRPRRLARRKDGRAHRNIVYQHLRRAVAGSAEPFQAEIVVARPRDLERKRNVVKADMSSRLASTESTRCFCLRSGSRVLRASCSPTRRHKSARSSRERKRASGRQPYACPPPECSDRKSAVAEGRGRTRTCNR